MKGRVFDPVQKRFLSPDPHVPDPLSSQSYNRFSYVANNPLRYTDPTGFFKEEADLRRKGASTQPDGGADAPTPVVSWPVVLTHPWIVVVAKADDTGSANPPPPPSPAEQEAKWANLMKHMAWGAAQRLWSSLPPVAIGRQIYRNFQTAGTALRQAQAGDWDLAANTMLDIPQASAEAAARVLTGPVEAALSIPGSVQTAMNSDADPEQRGAAAVDAAQAIVAVVATVVGAGAAKKATSNKPHGNSLDTTKPARGYTLRDAKTGEVLKYGETTLGTKRYSKSFLKETGARMRFEASGTKREMHDWQHQKILDYKANNGGRRPPLNKSDY